MSNIKVRYKNGKEFNIIYPIILIIVYNNYSILFYNLLIALCQLEVCNQLMFFFTILKSMFLIERLLPTPKVVSEEAGEFILNF